jgi:hypothetical protein
MPDSNIQLSYATAEATGISRASGSLEEIMSAINFPVETVTLIVYCVVFCIDFVFLHYPAVFYTT